MAKDPRHTRSGLPDLVVWNTSSKSSKVMKNELFNTNYIQPYLVLVEEDSVF